MKKYLFVKKIQATSHRKSPIFKFDSDIRYIINLFIDKAPTFIKTQFDENQIQNSHGLCLESFSRIIWSYNLMINIKNYQKEYVDGNQWRIILTEIFLNYFFSFQDHFLIFLYYFYKKHFLNITNEKQISFSTIFNKNNKKIIKILNLKRTKDIICSSDFKILVGYRHLIDHRTIPFYANVYDQESPGGRQESKLHSTNFHFDDFDIESIETHFTKVFPKIIGLMSIIGLKYNNWATKKEEQLIKN